jgi:hypothetical protein
MAALQSQFRHCSVGHFSPDQFQFWLVTVSVSSSIPSLKGTVPRPRLPCGSIRSTDNGSVPYVRYKFKHELELVGAIMAHDGHRQTLHSALAGHDNFRKAGRP